MPGQELIEAPGGMVGDAREDVGEPGARIDATELACRHEGIDHRCALATTIGAGEQP